MESYASALQVYSVGLVFVRVAAMVMLLPGVGEPAVPARIRLAFAFLLALVLAPIAAPGMGAVPSTVAGVAGGEHFRRTNGEVAAFLGRLGHLRSEAR